jgi:hypothetical protein
MVSSQGTHNSKVNKGKAILAFIPAYRSLQFLFLFFFSDTIMADVASKQQTAALFLSTRVTRTRRRTELKKKTDKPDGKTVLC